MFSCAPYIKEIGRGKEGARGLTTEQACTLFSAMLSGQVSDLELGAVLLCFRVKGESTDELLGFCQAARQTLPLLLSFRAQGKPPIVIPSYNGARRRPNYTPLLAGLLAKAGHPVLVHGLPADPTGRVTTSDVFDALGWARCSHPDRMDAELQAATLRQEPLFVDIHALHPGLASLIDKRAILGVRNSSHTIVKFLQPFSHQEAVMLASYTHPEFWHLQRDVLARMDATALVLRGHEGEPVAHPQRTPRMDGVFNGHSTELDAGDATFVDTPDPHPLKDAASTADMVKRYLRSDAQSLPPGFVRQLAAIERLIASRKPDQ